MAAKKSSNGEGSAAQVRFFEEGVEHQGRRARQAASVSWSKEAVI